MLIYPLFFIMVFVLSCSGQEKDIEENDLQLFTVPLFQPEEDPNPKIAEYIRNIHQDKNGNLWFGTNGYGVAHYDGDSVSYFSNAQGFHGQQLTGMTEDAEKNIWFATDQGVVKYDWSSNEEGGKRFVNYTDEQYFGGQRFWSICADSKNRIWAGSATGIFRFDGKKWAPFALPLPEDVTGDFITVATSWSISEDRAGNMWFSTNGYGAFKYDGQSFTQYSKISGLSDDRVDVIMEDSRGTMWFGTRFGGLSQFDGISFINYTARDSIGNNEVCALYEDKEGHIWFSSEGYGVYRYNGESFTNFSQQQGLQVGAVQTIFEDREGRFWVGGGGGLYRYDGESFFHVSKNGPWE